MSLEGYLLALMIIKIVSWDNVLEAQWRDVEIKRIRATLGIEDGIPFQIMENGLLMIGNWICIPKNSMLKKEILEGAHIFCFTAHPESIKMYIDLKKYYWWPNIKREMVEFVARCVICQQIKVEHYKQTRWLQPFSILEWKLKDITIDFVSGLLKGKRWVMQFWWLLIGWPSLLCFCWWKWQTWWINWPNYSLMM